MKKILIFAVLTVFLGTFPVHVFAAEEAPTTASICSYASDKKSNEACIKCMNTDKRVWTAIGCVSSTGGGFTGDLLKIGTGVGGGIALLLILFGSLQIMTSAGNPEKLSAGKELVTAAITGLLFIIFSVFILQLVGVTILKLPDWGI